MVSALSFLAVVLVGFLFALAARPLLTLRGTWGTVVGVLASLSILLFPFAIPSEFILSRGCSAFLCTDWSFKMLDYQRIRRCRRSDVESFLRYLQFLIPFPILLVVWEEKFRPRKWSSNVWNDLFLAGLGVAGVGALVGLFYVASRQEVFYTSFLLTHGMRVFFLMAIIFVSSALLHRMERALGYDIQPLVNGAFLARTPAEFWANYNTRVHSWLTKNVFVPVGGWRFPLWGIMVTFFVSAIHHEFSFDFATSSVTGYQFLFFMIQAPAVAASRSLDRLSRRHGVLGEGVLRTFTWVWFVTTSVFFLDGMLRVFRFFDGS